jgi:SAM-dependent methyltransferase
LQKGGGSLKCHLCHQDTEKFIVKNRKFERTYYKCKNCSFIFVEKDAVLKRDKELIRYNMHNNSIEDPLYRDYFNKFIEYSFLNLEGVKKVLDYGSGPQPVLASVLRERGYNVDIYDKYFSPEKIFEDRKYDLITMTEVIEHIYYPIEVFKEISAALKNGGYFAIMTNFHKNSLEEFKKWWYIQDPTHIAFYNMDTFRYIGEKFGLKILKNNGKNIVIFKKEN